MSQRVFSLKQILHNFSNGEETGLRLGPMVGLSPHR